jgi:hypothetical protein
VPPAPTQPKPLLRPLIVFQKTNKKGGIAELATVMALVGLYYR